MPNKVDEQGWVKYYEKLMPVKEQQILFSGNVCEELDAAITMDELVKVVSKLPTKKAPGPDGVSNKFLKSLPESGMNALLNIFNKI